MFDENEHTHPQNNDEGPRHIHRGIKRSEPDEVEVDSADFFSPEPPCPPGPHLRRSRRPGFRLNRRSLPSRPTNSGSRCTPVRPPLLPISSRKEEWSCWDCRPS